MALERVSSAVKDQYEVQAGFQEGRGEIIAAVACVHQFPGKGQNYPPALMTRITIQRLNDKWEPTDAEPAEEYLGWGRKALETIQVANAPSRDAAMSDVEPLGDVLGTEGNTVVADGGKLNNKTAWGIFAKSCEEKGFKPEIMRWSYMPDLVGMKALFKQVKGQKFDDSQDKDPSYLVVEQIHVYPYENAGKSKAAAPKVNDAVAAAKAKLKGKAPTAAPEPAKASSNGSTGSDEAIAILSELAGKLSGTTATREKLVTMARTSTIKQKLDKSVQSGVLALIGDEDWLIQNLDELKLGEVEGESVNFS